MNKYILLLVLLFCSLNATSANFGNYKYATKSDMVWDPAIGALAPPAHWNILYTNGKESENDTTKMWFCTDSTNKKVLGKLINGYCYVEWKGKEYANSRYYLLVSPYSTPNAMQHSFTLLNNTNKSAAMLNGITAGVVDAGNYSYHCIIWERYRVRSGSLETITTFNITLGKYIPSQNRCYYGYNSKGYYRTSTKTRINNSDVILETLLLIPTI